jgi:peptide chain release factor 2
VEEWEDLARSRDNSREWVEMAASEQSEEMLQALDDALVEMETKLEAAQMRTLLSDPEDVAEAILEIHPGAGGTESQDWAEMLLRMYRRFAERSGFKVELLDLLPGDEAGVKSVTLHIHGPYAYGQLKGEKGTHRLIRISPFDSSGRRHTSFASVDVYPDAGQDIEIEVRDEDIRVDIFRSSGPGGQSVNTTDSAVRITHIPTGLVAQCQNEKSQHKNKEAAMKVLKARLYELELQKIANERRAEYLAKGAIAFGSQIRTYTLQPYRLVKDHRTGTETSNVDAVLDGNIDAFIHNFLLHLHAKA